MIHKPKIIIIVGQTSTGKSDFAVEIAKVLAVSGVESEIISADSRQVYRGMDLGTGKITKSEMQGILHHLLDVVSPKKVFSVAEYKKLAEKKIQEIQNRGAIPLLVGGTGFYIDAVIHNTILPDVPPNKKLRLELSKKSAKELYEILKKLDPTRANNIDEKNPVRLLRAIEIATTLEKVPKITTKDDPVWYLKIGLMVPDEVLKEKIRARLYARIKKGMLREIRDLHRKGISWRRMEAFGLEYRYGALYMQGKMTKQEMIEKLNTEIWHYAKRQKTWFKRDKNIIWIDPRTKSVRSEVLEKIKEYLK